MVQSIISIYGRCSTNVSENRFLVLTKQLVMCMLGFDQEEHGLDYSVLLRVTNKVEGVGCFGCDLEVEAGDGFDPEKYRKDLEEWLNDQLGMKSGFLSVTCTLKKEATADDAAVAPLATSKFSLGKVIGMSVITHNDQEISAALKEDVLKLTIRFFDSEAKGGNDKLSVAMIPNPEKTRQGKLAFHLFVSADFLSGSEEACGQRIWALCQRLETWLNVQLFAKYPEYNTTICTIKLNELKISML